ncbi:MAG: glycosyltransferase family 4 protein [Pseudomonadota bacterium]
MANNQKLRIVHILRAPMGGVLRHVRDLAMIHTSLGHDVGIICDVEGTEGYNEALIANLDKEISLGVTRSPMSRSVGPSDIFSASKILKILKEMKPDVVHGHGAKGGVFARTCGSLVSTSAGKPLRFYSPHGGSLHFDPQSKEGKVYFRVERILEKMTDGLSFVAKYEQDSYQDKIGVPHCASDVIYNGLADDEFEPVQLVENPADFLFIGELRMLKGPDLMLRAVSRLKAEGADDINAVLVGAGPDRDELHQMIKDRDLQTNVTIRPAMPARAAFQLAKCVVMPSRAEAMPYIVLEALAARCPLIATNVGGIPEIFGSASDVLVEPDVDQLTARMRQAMEELPSLIKRMPNHETLQRQFNADLMAEHMLDAYRNGLKLRRNS